MAGRRRRQARGIGGIQEKLRACVDAGDHYEALQMYRAVVARKYAAGDVETAFELVRTGATTLLGAGLDKECCDLIFMLVDTTDKTQDDQVQKLMRIVAQVAAAMQPSPEQLSLAETVLRHGRGHALLRDMHAAAAASLVAGGQPAAAARHLAAARLVEQHAEVVGTVADAEGVPCAAVACREALRYAALGDAAAGRALLAGVKGCSRGDRAMLAAKAVLEAVDEAEVDDFASARERFSDVFSRDQDSMVILGRVARDIFRIQPRSTPLMSMMQAMMGGQPQAAPRARAPAPVLRQAAPAPAPKTEEDLDDLLDDIDL